MACSFLRLSGCSGASPQLPRPSPQTQCRASLRASTTKSGNVFPLRPPKGDLVPSTTMVMHNASSALALRLGCLVALLVALFVSSFAHAAAHEQSYPAAGDMPEEPSLSKVLHESPPSPPPKLLPIYIFFCFLFAGLVDRMQVPMLRVGMEPTRSPVNRLHDFYRSVCIMSLSLTFPCQVMTMTMMTMMTTGRMMNTWHGSSKPWSCLSPSLLLVLSSPVGCTEEGYSLKGANTLRCNMSPPLQ